MQKALQDEANEKLVFLVLRSRYKLCRYDSDCPCKEAYMFSFCHNRSIKVGQEFSAFCIFLCLRFNA